MDREAEYRRAFRMQIGRELRRARTEYAGGYVSQQVIAELAGTSQAAWCNWENGIREIRLYDLFKITAALHIDPFAILESARREAERATAGLGRVA